MIEQTAAVRDTNGPKIVQYAALVDRVSSIFEEIQRRAYQIFETNGHQLGRDRYDWFQAERELLHPVQIDVTENDQSLEVKAEVPGLSEKELEISVEPQRLTITGKRDTRAEEKKGNTIYSETRAFDVLRTIALPVEVETAKASATLKNGVLSLSLPKLTKTQAIQVQAKAA